MKIKVWALVLIIFGSLIVGAGGMFAAMSGVSLVSHLVQNVQAAVPRISIQSPYGGNYGFGGNYGNGNGNYGGNSGSGSGFGSMPGQGGSFSVSPEVPALPSDLPAGFNAGVNIDSTYAELTNRTVQQVQTAEQNAGVDAWGLAKQEGKLDDLKAKVTDAVAASLKTMVSNGKITQAQSDEYLSWVKQYLQTVAQTSRYSRVPFGRGSQSNSDPSATQAPSTQS